MDEGKYRQIKAICMIVATVVLLYVSYFLCCHLRYHVDDYKIIDKATGKISPVKLK